jgi:hypothetical protein
MCAVHDANSKPCTTNTALTATRDQRWDAIAVSVGGVFESVVRVEVIGRHDAR